MDFKIKARTTEAGYGVTPFDTETGESLSELFGTKIFATLEQAVAYAQQEVASIVAVGDEASYVVVE